MSGLCDGNDISSSSLATTSVCREVSAWDYAGLKQLPVATVYQYSSYAEVTLLALQVRLLRLSDQMLS